MAIENKSWNLESFLDSLVVELDKARETLAIKAINRPLSYSVKDLSLDLQIFPSFDGEEVKFLTAQPGETGSSKISVQLASITDHQVRATSKKPSSREDISIDSVDIDEDTKKDLRKIGVTSVNDLKEIEQKNVDLEKVSPKKKLNYKDLLNRIEKAKRNKTNPPRVSSASTSFSDGNTFLVIKGENLAINRSFEPVVVIDNQLSALKNFNESEIRVQLSDQNLKKSNNEVIVTLDPFSIFKFNLKR